MIQALFFIHITPKLLTKQIFAKWAIRHVFVDRFLATVG